MSAPEPRWTYVTPRDTGIRYRIDGRDPGRTTGKFLSAGERLELDEVQAANFRMLALMKDGTVDVVTSPVRLQ